MGFPKVNEWPEQVYQAGTVGGFNILRDMEKALHHAIPDLRPYNIGFFVETDLKSVMPMGWIHMDYGHLDFETKDDFNRAIGLRYGLTIDANGHLKVGDNFIMIMPKNYRERIIEERKRALDKQNAMMDGAAAYAHPSDPRASEMKAGAYELSEKGSERYKVQVKGEPERSEAKRGRPPKN